jgi:P-type Cu2+ transporter
VEAILPGDLIRVLPDELLPADGEVTSGSSAVNLSLLTGESTPAPIRPGDAVLAGTRNLDSPVDIRVKSAGETTRLGRLMKLVERGVSDRAPVVRMADRLGYYFTFSVIGASALAFGLGMRHSASEGMDRALALLIVACPCVLGLTTPLTFSLAIGMLARKKILVKSATALEMLSKPGVMLLDKTGTLTQGRMKVTRMAGDESVLLAIAALERHSTHPVARILAEGNTDALIENPKRIFDGMEGTMDGGRRLLVGSEKLMRREGMKFVVPTETDGPTAVFAAVDGEVRTRIDLEDPIRPDVKQTLDRLQVLGWELKILSGDRASAVAKVARALGIEEAFAELSPEDKLNEAKKRTFGKACVMVGDGANDAAALAAADVGIALRGGAEIALAAADVYIADEHPGSLLTLVNAARSAMKTIRVNLGISLGYNVLAATLAALGYMNPLIAAILMPASSATVTALAIAKMRKVAGK